jgi:hypothetical protein
VSCLFGAFCILRPFGTKDILIERDVFRQDRSVGVLYVFHQNIAAWRESSDSTNNIWPFVCYPCGSRSRRFRSFSFFRGADLKM